jgi:hypothetical protein
MEDKLKQDNEFHEFINISKNDISMDSKKASKINRENSLIHSKDYSKINSSDLESTNKSLDETQECTNNATIIPEDENESEDVFFNLFRKFLAQKF